VPVGNDDDELNQVEPSPAEIKPEVVDDHPAIKNIFANTQRNLSKSEYVVNNRKSLLDGEDNKPEFHDNQFWKIEDYARQVYDLDDLLEDMDDDKEPNK
jgi:hypothetical protein